MAISLEEEKEEGAISLDKDMLQILKNLKKVVDERVDLFHPSLCYYQGLLDTINLYLDCGTPPEEGIT